MSHQVVGFADLEICIVTVCSIFFLDDEQPIDKLFKSVLIILLTLLLIRANEMVKLQLHSVENVFEAD